MKRYIPVEQLLVDTQNPRLPDIQSDQDDAIRLMLKSQGSKIFALAQHLVENGPNPASLPIVIPALDEAGKYYVLDGNRRLTSLRLLERPDLGDGAFGSLTSQKIKTLSVKYKNRPIDGLECVIYDDREQADPWIQLIHRGERDGAGLVRWDGQVGARYDERKGQINKAASTALKILDFIKDDETVSKITREKIESGNFPITTLTRLIGTPYVRTKIELDPKKDITSFDDKTIKDLARMVEDLGTEQITVSDLKRVEQRVDYVDRLSEPRESATTEPIIVSTIPASAAVSIASNKKKTVKEKKPRNTLIPRDFSASITQHRINKIFRELKQLDANSFANAAAVMLRVFLELSLDHYIEETIRWPEPRRNNSTLAEKMNAVANDLENKTIMTKQQLTPIRKAAGGQTFLAASVKTFNAYVHNRYASAIPSELKTAWDDLELFISKLWPS